MLIYYLLVNLLIILLVNSRYFVTVSHNLPISYGYFRGDVLCQDNSWLSGYRLHNNCGSWGTVSITFQCSNLNGDIVETLNFSPASGYSSNDDTYMTSCYKRKFITYSNFRVMCCDLNNDDLGLNGMDLICNDGKYLTIHGCSKGSWRGYKQCPVRTAGCGYNIKEADQNDGDTLGDDLSIIEMKLLCCPICKIQNGFFLNNNVCERCDDNCLTCDGPNSNNCLTCGVSDTLTSGTCIHSSNFYLKEQIYYNGGAMPTGFTSSNAVENYVCNGIKMIKITNSGNIEKLWTQLTPHYKIRLKARIYKLDDWAGESIEISIDGNRLNIPSLQNLGIGDKLFFDDFCSNGGGSEDIIFVDQELYHSGSSSLTLKFSSTGTKSFGVSSISLILYKCDPTCKTCIGPANTECTTCFQSPNSTWDSVTGKCFCNDGFLESVNSNCIVEICTVCQTCYTGCKKCTIPNSNTACDSCMPNYFYEATTHSCLANCISPKCGRTSSWTCEETCLDPITEFIDPVDRICKSCIAKSYLLIPENKTCVACDKPGQLKDESKKICYSCIGNCDKCNDVSSCEVCSAGYFQSTDKKCVQQKSLYATLKPMSLPTTVTISFSDTWPLLMNNFKSYCSLSIVGLDSRDFSFNFIKNSFLSFEGDFNLTFLKFVDSTNILNIIINKEDGSNDEFIIKNKKFSMNLMPYCIPPTIYSKDIKKCIDTSFITPSLEYGTNSTTFILTFFKGYGDTYETYKQFTYINIEGYNKSVYSFNINRTKSSPDIYMILLNFNVSVPNTPKMIINLNPTKAVFLKELQLSIYDLEIQLKNIYVLDESTAKLIENTKSATETLNSISGSAFAANNAVTSGASFSFRSLASMDVIRYLRYFEIDYPPNVLVMFETEMPKLDLIPNINIKENPVDGNLPTIFDKYGVSIYIFNNNGNQIIEILVYLFLGCILLLLYQYALHKITKIYIFYFIVFFKLSFVWGFPLSSFLAAYMLINFYTYLSFRFPTYTTTTGIINQVLSIIMGIFVLLFLPLLVLKIKKVMPILKKKSTMTLDSNKIFPEGVKILEHSVSNEIVSADLEPLKEDKKKILKNSKSYTTVDEDNSAKKLQHPVFHKSTYLNIENTDSPKFFPEEISPGIKSDSGGLSFTKLNKNPTSNFIDSINIDNSAQLKKNDKHLSFEKLKKSNYAQGAFADHHSDTMIKKDTEPLSPDKLIKEGGKNNDLDLLKNINKDNASQISDKNNIGLIGSIISPFSFKKDSFFDTPPKMESLKNIKRLSKTSSMNKSETQSIDKKKDNTDWKSSFNKDDEYRRYAPFYKDFKHLYSIQSYYIVFDLARQSLFSIILVMFFDSPFKGLVMINIFNVFYFLILLTIKPFKVLVDELHAFINEFCILTASISTLCLSIMDKFQIRDLEVKINFGWAIVFSNYLLIAVFLIRVLLVLIKFFIFIMRAIYRYIVDKWKNRYKVKDNIIEFDPKKEMEKINKYFD